jgi:hypothetical protein
MQNCAFRAGPVALTNSAANILNPGTTTGGVNCTGAPWDKLYLIIKSIYVADKGGAGGTFTLYVGATGASAAGTEIAKTIAVATNSYVRLDFPGGLRLNQADFLVGLAAANTTLTITVVGEIGVGA